MCCSVSVSVCVVCLTVFGETICNVFGFVAILLLNVMDVISVGGGALLDSPCMVFQRLCIHVFLP